MAPVPVSPVDPIECPVQTSVNPVKPHTHKKIFVFCDGTGNKFSGEAKDKTGNSNVVKLYTTLRVADDQVAYYHPGLGTMGDPSIRWRIPRFWSKLKGLAFGSGFKANVLDAYRYLMETYNDGDDIYIFGFSRGAYTARALAGMLHGYGLLCRGNDGHREYVWNMFHKRVKRTREGLKKRAKGREDERSHSITHNFAFSEIYSRRVRIRFMGLWDTVSSVGWIHDPVRLLDMAQNPTILVGRHAVSIDERRAYYRDNLWGPPVDINHPEWPADLRKQGIEQDLVQVWFPGAHSDIGGSYPQCEAAPANESLEWMIGELQKHGAQLCKERVAMVLGTPSGRHSADRVFTPPEREDHCTHDSLKWYWWPLQCFPQQYYDKEDSVIQWRVPYGTPRHLSDAAIVHGSAERRLRITTEGEQAYCPRNLKRDHLQPLTAQIQSTTANLTGCFVFTTKPGLLPEPDSKPVRLLKVGLGWITFGLFLASVTLAAWYLFGLVVWIAGVILSWGPVRKRTIEHAKEGLGCAAT